VTSPDGEVAVMSMNYGENCHNAAFVESMNEVDPPYIEASDVRRGC